MTAMGLVDMLDGSAATPAATRGRTAPGTGGRSFADAVQDALAAAATAIAGGAPEEPGSVPMDAATGEVVRSTAGGVAPPSAALPGAGVPGLSPAVDVADGSTEPAGGTAPGLEPTAGVPSSPISVAGGFAEAARLLGSGAADAGDGDPAASEGAVEVTGPIGATAPAAGASGGTTAEVAWPPLSAAPASATAAGIPGVTTSSTDATARPVPALAQNAAASAAESDPAAAGAPQTTPPRDASPQRAPDPASAEPTVLARDEASVAPAAQASRHPDAIVHSPSAAAPAAPALVQSPPSATTPPPDASTAAAARSVAFPQQLAGPVLSLARSGAGDHRITVTVSPESLGPVTVRAHIAGGAIHIELHAPSDAGRDALRAVLADLRRDLAAAAPHASLAVAPHDTGSTSPGSSSPSGSAHPQSHGGGAQTPERRAGRDDPPHAPPAPAEQDPAAPAAGIEVYA